MRAIQPPPEAPDRAYEDRQRALLELMEREEQKVAAREAVARAVAREHVKRCQARYADA